MSTASTWIKTYYYVWMPYVVMVILVICGYAYTNYAIHKSERELCEVITPLDQAYRQTPPTTAAGRNFAKAIHDQYVRRGCTDG